MKILFPTPALYDGNDSRFVQRDGARFAQSLERSANRGIKVILRDELDDRQPASPLLCAGTWRQWTDSFFWKSFQADGALCYFGFGVQRFFPVIRAMKGAGLRIALKMDSALGLYRFPHYLRIALFRAYWMKRQHAGPVRSSAYALRRAFSPIFRHNISNLLNYIDTFDVITAESPLARDNTKAWLESYGRKDLARRVALLHHPVPDSFVPSDIKSNRLIAVAKDWSNPLKGGGILQNAFLSFLDRHKDWSATIIGKNSNRFNRLQSAHGGRVALLPALPPEELLPHYQASNILCIASGSESGPIVAFEALSCGCSIVFPPTIPQLEWTIRNHSGTPAKSRTVSGLVHALEGECNIWTREPNRAKSIVASLPPLHTSECLGILLRDWPNLHQSE